MAKSQIVTFKNDNKNVKKSKNVYNQNLNG